MDGVLMGARLAAVDVDCDIADADFRMIAELIHREAGIVIRDHKRAMVRGRLARRARELGLATVAEYCRRLRGKEMADELTGLLNALTTNHTAFYREEHHFGHLEQVALPGMPEAAERRGRLRLWCAAASTGEEPYTIAATLEAFFGTRRHPDCLLLATDLDTDVIATAETGRYAPAAFDRLTAAQRERLGARRAEGGQFEIGQSLRQAIRFRALNILCDWPFRGPFQAIFCRNMLIYFDQPTKTGVIARMADALAPGGYLYLGHSEAIPAAMPGLRACGRTVYRKD
jgi:chemotaxis protein methyltransferase CheR